VRQDAPPRGTPRARPRAALHHEHRDAALFRAIDQRKPTLFLDEVDAAFNPKARERGTKDELRSLLNAGYRRGQFVYRMGGGNHTTLERFEVFGAKALAGLGSLPLTLQSRCIRLELTRRRADEPVETSTRVGGGR
jgi:putative DNA primase/helicase